MMIMTFAKKYGTHKETCIILASCSRTERLHDFTVGLTNTLITRARAPHKVGHQVCYKYVGEFPAATRTLICTRSARGRYLFIQIITKWRWEFYVLTLCEVKVHAETGM